MKQIVLLALAVAITASPARIAMRPVWVYGPCTKQVGCPYATESPLESTTIDRYMDATDNEILEVETSSEKIQNTHLSAS
uniref:Uncharacterized protein n=1 Tax=Steinernema glaseri TaxID=37863 RepID=A0A1I7YQ70_9BILA